MSELNLPELDSYSYAPLREQVYEILKDSILNGDIPPQQKLKETRVANELNVSRTPVREALLMLELEGMIRISPQDGFVVQGITDKKQVNDLFQVRGQLEGMAARLAAENITPDNLHQLKSTLELMKTKMEDNPDAREDFLKFEFFFHRLIYQAADNEYLNEALNKLFEKINRFRSKSFTRMDRMKEVYEELEEIYNHIAAGEAEKAERAALDHLHNAEKAVKESFDL